MASKKRNMKLKGRLKSYTQTSLYLGFLLVAVNLLVYILDVPSGLVLTCFTLFYFGITVLLQLYNKPIIMNELVSFATQYGQIQKVLLRELELPYAMLDEEGRLPGIRPALMADAIATSFGLMPDSKRSYIRKRDTVSPLHLCFRQSPERSFRMRKMRYHFPLHLKTGIMR